MTTEFKIVCVYISNELGVVRRWQLFKNDQQIGSFTSRGAARRALGIAKFRNNARSLPDAMHALRGEKEDVQ